MILCEWDAAEGHPGQSCVHLYARILSMSFTSVLILSVCCYSIVSISMRKPQVCMRTRENSQDYALKRQRNCTFMNSASEIEEFP